MHHISDLESLKDEKALRREKRKRLRMKQHGKSLKKITPRPILHIHKISKKR